MRKEGPKHNFLNEEEKEIYDNTASPYYKGTNRMKDYDSVGLADIEQKFREEHRKSLSRGGTRANSSDEDNPSTSVKPNEVTNFWDHPLVNSVIWLASWYERMVQSRSNNSNSSDQSRM